MFGEKLKKLRKSHDLSQEELGQIVKTSNANISNWERGYASPDIDSIIAIANFFGVSTDYLFGINRSEKEKKEELKRALFEAGIDDIDQAMRILEVLRKDKDIN